MGGGFIVNPEIVINPIIVDPINSELIIPPETNPTSNDEVDGSIDNNANNETIETSQSSETIVISEAANMEDNTEMTQADSGGSMSFGMFSLFGLLLWRNQQKAS